MSHKFALGKIVWTRGINELVAADIPFSMFVWESLKRHAACDWGDLSIEDKQENDFSLDKRLRLFSAYRRMTGKYGLLQRQIGQLRRYCSQRSIRKR